MNRINAERGFRARETVTSGMPYYLTVEPTNFCNLRCPLCFASLKEGYRKRGYMEWDTYVKVLDFFGPYLLKLQLYNQGEPLLHEGIYDMVALAAKRKIKTQISTNLTVFDERHARRLVNSGLDSLVVSIDGATPETYAKYRVGGDFNTVMENLKLLLRIKREMKSHTPRILWSFLLFRHNLAERDRARRMARELGVEILMQSAILGGVVPSDSRDPELLQEWLPKGDGIPRLFDYFSNQAHLNPSICPWPWQSFVVLWDGSIAHCCHVDTSIESLGSIPLSDPSALWNAGPFQSSRNEFRKQKEEGRFEPVICRKCEIYRKP